MAVQPLNQVQIAFVNEAVRPMIESLLRADAALRSFVLDYDNQQTAILTSADDLGDNVAGNAPREDAPILTGASLLQLRNLCNTRILDETTERNPLIALSVRTYDDIVRGIG